MPKFTIGDIHELIAYARQKEGEFNLPAPVVKFIRCLAIDFTDEGKEYKTKIKELEDRIRLEKRDIDSFLSSFFT